MEKHSAAALVILRAGTGRPVLSRKPAFASRPRLLASGSMDAARPIAIDETGTSPEPARGAAKATDEAGRVTPMMEQYSEIKAANPDCLLFYRMGDFYELFFDDAEIASRALGIVLTKRGKHLGRDIPMCGVPIERADEYLHRLIALGHRVAVCEQLEDPAEARKRGAKSVVRRDVVRLVTPGTLTETRCSTRGATTIFSRWRGRARHPTRTASRLPGSIFRPASSASASATARHLPPRSPGSSRAKSSSRMRFIPTRNSRRICARCRR